MRIVACAFLAVLGASAAIAQSGSPQVQQPIRVGTNLVRVDVYPTRDGRVVEGLTSPDFEVLEDGVPQKIETFEHVTVAIGPHSARVDPASQQEMLRAVGNPRNRVFLIFLDAPHVEFQNSHAINGPLVDFMTNYMGDDDLVGVMTPEMSVRQVVFGRKTAVIEDGLRRYWSWGRKNQELDPERDRREIQYELCFPPLAFGDVAARMIARRRERVTLESLQDAVRYFHGYREERKAIVTVSEGWRIFREDPTLLEQGPNVRPTGIDKIHVGPTGQLTTEDKRNSVNALSTTECDRDRSTLARTDNDQLLRDIIDDANRGNATFYMVDPKGLSVRGSDPSGAMRTLADNTDGFTIRETNDLKSGMKRISDDMSSYYLLGYYATNAKPDGRFRSITVRVKQPNVQVRARRGYRAPTEAEIAAGRPAPELPSAAGAAGVSAALSVLGGIRPDTRFRINAAAWISGRGTLWVAGELQSAGGRPDEFAQGSTAAVEGAGNGVSVTARVALKPGERTFLVRLDLPAGASGALDVRAQLTSDEGTSPPLTDRIRVSLAPSDVRPMLFRRGVTTGNRLLPAADLRFSRTERIRLELPVGPGERDGKPGTGRVLDRGGLETQVPVVVTERTEEGSGQRWITSDVTLAALSPGDYVIEVVLRRETGEQKVLAPIRVVP
jgi:VWFA-related protein